MQFVMFKKDKVDRRLEQRIDKDTELLLLIVRVFREINQEHDTWCQEPYSTCALDILTV